MSAIAHGSLRGLGKATTVTDSPRGTRSATEAEMSGGPAAFTRRCSAVTPPPAALLQLCCGRPCSGSAGHPESRACCASRSCRRHRDRDGRRARWRPRWSSSGRISMSGCRRTVIGSALCRSDCRPWSRALPRATPAPSLRWASAGQPVGCIASRGRCRCRQARPRVLPGIVVQPVPPASAKCARMIAAVWPVFGEFQPTRGFPVLLPLRR